MLLKDKAIIVTGSTTGIGEAIARRCVAEGASVLIHGLEPDLGRRVATDLGDRAALHIDNLLNPDAPHRLIAATLDTFGRLDGLVNNAANLSRSDLETTDADFFDQIMAVNARAPLLMIQAALRHLKQSQGSVVNIGSINAYTGEPRLLAYSMSKAALMALSRNLANVLAPDKVRVNHFNVGWVLTPNEYRLKISEGLPEGWSDHPDPADVPTGRMTQPEEIAAHAAFWLSDDSRPISGSVIELEQYPIIGRIPLKEGQ
ncbi:MAG: SDR family oxidoreductase [Anaerolineae bacterium]|nr:SDR family oxidoreductase [Anaerolineae bacterium]